MQERMSEGVGNWGEWGGVEWLTRVERGDVKNGRNGIFQKHPPIMGLHGFHTTSPFHIFLTHLPTKKREEREGEEDVNTVFDASEICPQQSKEPR